MPERADISPPPTLSSTLSHSEVLLKPMSSVREVTERLRPRNVPKRPRVTNSDTALFKNRSWSISPESFEPMTSAMTPGVLVSFPYSL